ncbi:SpoVR family protein [Bacteroidota bacterium]
MELIDQHTKKLMEQCKVRAFDAGLKFDDESLEYIVTNRDLLELSPKVMIPTLYDYWVHDVEVLKESGKYKLYPNNPYETVINSRPAVSFYNDNNPDWLNIMIFYHVLGHIDFFQNNVLFEKTWDDDFVGQALADKRLIASLRSQHGRWVDYVIEFSRSINNLVGYYIGLSKHHFPKELEPSSKIDYYFDVFLQQVENVPEHEFFREIERYNKLLKEEPSTAESSFFSDAKTKYPEFQSKYEKHIEKEEDPPVDLMEFIMKYSPFLQKEENLWMKEVITIVRNTALYFGPQMRSKIINEGWASYWHDDLFRTDDRIKGHESAYAKTNAMVTSLSRVGLNPYAIGLRLIQYVEELANKGKLSYFFQRNQNSDIRENYDQKTGRGREAIFDLRTKFSDFMLVNTFVDQDFVDMHDLFVVGQRANQERRTMEYYIKSRKAKDYKQMILDSLAHPPNIKINVSKTDGKNLYLNHVFEGKQLYKDYINDTMVGIEYLWGGQVELETTEIVIPQANIETQGGKVYRRVHYTMKDKKLIKKNL